MIRSRLEALQNRFKNYALFTAGLLVFLLPFEKTPSFDFLLFGSSVTLRLSTLTAIALIALSLPHFIVRYRDFLRMPSLGLLIFLFLYMVSAALARELGRALLVLGFTSLTVVTALAISIYVDEKFLAKAKRALYWATWIVVVFGFYQYFGDLLGLPTTLTGLRADYTKVVFGFPRIQSTGLEPLYYANFLLIPFFVFAADFLKGQEGRKYLLLAVATQIALSVSRGAYAGAILGLVLLVIFSIRAKIKTMQLIGLGSIVILSVVLALFMTSLEFKIDKNESVSGEKKAEAIVAQATNFDTQDDRDRNRDLAWNAFTEAPLFGYGPGGFDKFAREAAPIYVGMPGRIIVNNEPLELLAEGGIFVFLTLAVSLLWLYGIAVKNIWAGTQSKESWIWLVGLVCYLSALAVQYQTFSTLYIMHIWVSIGLLVGLIGMSVGYRKPVSKN